MQQKGLINYGRPFNGKCANCVLSQRRGSPQGAVPRIVPTQLREGIQHGILGRVNVTLRDADVRVSRDPRQRPPVAATLTQSRQERELALTPKQQVMLWLREEHQGRTFAEFGRHLLQLPRSAAPSTKIGAQVATSIRIAMKGKDPGDIAQAVRQGRMEADFLILFVNRTNLVVLEEKQVRWLKILLLYEKCRNFVLPDDD